MKSSSIKQPSLQQIRSVRLTHLQSAPGESSCELLDEHSLFISLSPKPVHYVQTQDGKTHSSLHQLGDMLITPAGMPLRVRWTNPENCLHVRLRQDFVRQIAQETFAQDCDRLHLQPTFQTRHPQIESVARMLLAEQQQGSLANTLYTDSLANVLTVNLLRQYAFVSNQGRSPLPNYPGGLPHKQLQRILDYIDAHLAEEIRLSDLSGLLDMSHFHFSRQFKQSLGISPHQYLLQQRIEKAKTLLTATDQRVTDIAFTCGFSSSSHLSRQFKQLVGISPRSFRKQK